LKPRRDANSYDSPELVVNHPWRYIYHGGAPFRSRVC
jgi:hypothetical protein